MLNPVLNLIQDLFSICCNDALDATNGISCNCPPADGSVTWGSKITPANFHTSAK